jgi:hypothetical protein
VPIVGAVQKRLHILDGGRVVNLTKVLLAKKKTFDLKKKVFEKLSEK